MTAPIIQLKALGIDDLMKFEWVTAPPAESALRALEGLVAAGMLGEDGRLTPVGEKVAECPVEVNIAHMVSLLLCASPAVRLLQLSAL
jgi:ATP-dependent RNA helicase DDX35